MGVKKITLNEFRVLIKKIIKEEFSQKRFSLKIWETEDDRETGDTFSYTPEDTSLEGAIMEAQRLFYKMNYAAIEVIDDEDENEEEYYHISNDVPKGERYNR